MENQFEKEDMKELNDEKTLESKNKKRPWQPMKIEPLGSVGELVLGGGGKLSAVGGDPGEPRKNRPSG